MVLACSTTASNDHQLLPRLTLPYLPQDDDGEVFETVKEGEAHGDHRLTGEVEEILNYLRENYSYEQNKKQIF